MNTIQAYRTDPQKLARELAKIAVRSLYFEVKSHPKPGLVSFSSQGAHQDMNGESFYRSLFALRHYFYQLIIHDQQDATISQLKVIATRAETAMLNATQGVNTHRGAIFALGLFCVTTARLSKINDSFLPDDLHHHMIADWKESLSHHQPNPSSHGSQVIQQHRIVGAREMAIQGYPIIFSVLDEFLLLFQHSESLDACCLYAYARFLIEIDDTNIIYRKGMTGLTQAKHHAGQLLAIDCLKKRHDQALLLHQLFSEQQLSPGGVGDLIAVLLFVGQLFSEQLRWHC